MTKSKDFLKISCLSESFNSPKRADDKTAIKIMKIHEMECVGYKRGFILITKAMTKIKNYLENVGPQF